MKREFVPYTEALALKELGFDEPCMFVHDTWGNVINWTEDGRDEHKNSNINASIYYSAPLYQQAFRFFREKHGLFGIILPYLIIGNQWYYKITNRNNSSGLPFEEGFETYEEAELECIKKLIEIVKEKL